MKNARIRACFIAVVLVLAARSALATTINTTPSGTGSLTYSTQTFQPTCVIVYSGKPPQNVYYYSEAYSGSYTDPSGIAHPFSFSIVTLSPWYGIHAKANGCPKPVAFPYTKNMGPYYTLAAEYQLALAVRSGSPGDISAAVNATPGVAGFVNPKYKIVGIAYTVPGQQSSVQYTNTTMMGTSTSTSSSFSSNVASSIEICGGAGVGGTGTSVCGTSSNSFTQESDTSSSFAINQSTSFTNQWFPLTGPALDHGNDVIYVWVNPQVWYTMYPTSQPGPTPLFWNGFTFDETDDSNNMEVIPLRLSQLLNPSTIPAGIQGRLLRAWAPNNTDGTGPAITNQDLLTIAAADPFSNSNYSVTIGSDGKTTTDGRFTQITSNALFYLQGSNVTYNWGYTTTATAGQGGKNTYSQSFAIEVKNSNDWIANISFDWKNSTTFTWVDQWNSLMTQMMSQSNTVNVHGWTPPYTGPDEFNVYQDDVYGTFMVAPVPAH